MSSTIAADQACTPNISPVERRKRLASGVVALAIALVILTILMVFDAGRWWRLARYTRYSWSRPLGSSNGEIRPE